MNYTGAGQGLSISQRPASMRIILVRLSGELTSESACALAEWVEQVSDGYARAIHVDVSRLDFIDDGGAWTLALAFQCVRFHGNPVQVYNAALPLRRVLDAVCVDSGRAHDSLSETTSARWSSRYEHESLADDTPPPRGWLAMDVLACNEAPELSSMFAMFDRLGDAQGPPASVVLRSRWRTRS